VDCFALLGVRLDTGIQNQWCNIIGSIYGVSTRTYGFLYNVTNWTSIHYPVATNTWLSGISGNRIVGGYNNGTNSFIYTILELATVGLLAFGGLLLGKGTRV
jgi:hypothetical protein